MNNRDVETRRREARGFRHCFDARAVCFVDEDSQPDSRAFENLPTRLAVSVMSRRPGCATRRISRDSPFVTAFTGALPLQPCESCPPPKEFPRCPARDHRANLSFEATGNTRHFPTDRAMGWPQHLTSADLPLQQPPTRRAPPRFAIPDLVRRHRHRRGPCPPRTELHHRNQVRAVSSTGDKRPEYKFERNERQVRDNEIDSSADGLRINCTNIGSVDDVHPVIGLQAPHQLSVTDVDCDNFFRTTRQQNIGEPTGGCAGVEATATFDRQSFGTEASSAPISL